MFQRRTPKAVIGPLMLIGCLLLSSTQPCASQGANPAQEQARRAALKHADEVLSATPIDAQAALAAAHSLMDLRLPIDAANVTIAARDAAPTEAVRTEAVHLLAQLRPSYQKSADLQFVDALRKIKAGHVDEALPVIKRVWRLVYDPEEGLLTLSFVEFDAGNRERAVEMLRAWFKGGKRTPAEIASTRLAAYYNTYLVVSALNDDGVHELVVQAFGRYPAAHLDKVFEEARLPEEPPVKSVNPIDEAAIVLVPAGKFTMGDKATWNNPKRTMDVSEFWIYEKLVTVDMYRKFCKATGHAMPPEPIYDEIHFNFNAGWKKGNHPVVNVSWPDAVAYSAWAGMRLPTEAEFEKAARGVDGRRWPWGNTWDPHRLHHSVDDGDARGTAPVGKFPNGASPYGALDMVGNVFQWCSDYFLNDYWKYSPSKDPKGPTTGKDRAVRSGSWYDDDDVDFLAARRTGYPPNKQYVVVGFRCAG